MHPYKTPTNTFPYFTYIPVKLRKQSTGLALIAISVKRKNGYNKL